jgi:hypothetical protein
VLLGDAPFARFMAFSDWLYANTDATHRIALDRFAKMVGEWLVLQGLSDLAVAELMASDYAGKFKRGKSGAIPQRKAMHLPG